MDQTPLFDWVFARFPQYYQFLWEGQFVLQEAESLLLQAT